ncbi:MAG: alpha/beta hydrolase [Pirellulaceae bacterium]|nr:alpha/beta hydrolase [Pirellulaceae bacterium]
MLFRLAVCVSFVCGGVPLWADDSGFELREKIVYSKVDDRDLLLDAFVPNSDGVHPAVLVVHGGAWRSGNRKQLRGYATALADRGFVCFAIDYRLAPAHKFPAQIDDCRAAVKWIRQHAADYKADPTRLGAIGYSAGGHLVSLLGTTGEGPSEKNGNVDLRLQAVAAGGAPTDFRWFPDKGKWAEYWMGGTLETVPEKFQAASSAAFVDKDDPPTFFFNGTADKLVSLTWTRQCFNALKQAGVKTEMHIIQDAGHIQAAANEQALEKAYAFLSTQLRGRADANPSEDDSKATE